MEALVTLIQLIMAQEMLNYQEEMLGYQFALTSLSSISDPFKFKPVQVYQG
jgi:hypothetical protein